MIDFTSGSSPSSRKSRIKLRSIFTPSVGLYPRLVKKRDRRFPLAGSVFDGVVGTDGIDATGVVLPGFPHGLFVAQDDKNGEENQNFKLIDAEF